MKVLGATTIVIACILWTSCTRPMTRAATEPPATTESALPHPSELWPMPEDNGYDDLLAAIDLLPRPPEYAGPDASDIQYKGIDSFTEAELQAFLDAHQPVLDRLAEALSKPFVFPYEWLLADDPYSESAHDFTRMASARKLSSVLEVQAACYRRSYDHHRALQSLEEELLLGEDVSRGGTVINRLVTLSIETCAAGAWKDWVGSKPPSDLLQQAAAFLAEFEQNQVPLWQIVVMEGWISRAALDFCYGLELSAGEIHEAEQDSPEILELLKMDKGQVMEELDRHILALTHIVQMPLSEALEQDLPDVGIEELKLFSPNHVMPQWLGIEADTQAKLRGLQIMVALERYVQAQQAYPAVLEELVPEYLEQLPKDPFTDEDFVYRREDSLTYKLYSVGLNKRDDGGVEYAGGPKHGGPDIVVFPGPVPGCE